ncbi:TetR/AcrR family transcriptional regulator [Leifsonia sp. McL0607]|uniref:TetR/AcrR family transcriptional regulator n=1 Tax=Leifsonia sp. McL0607 TaxID=3415672 RepID=UPI003CEA417C
MSRPNASPRPLRADAQRNRDHLLAVARTAFAADADEVTLERIAKDAGVGIGTLYRHFPTREALVEAVYSAELDAVVADADILLSELPPLAALREWMNRYARFTASKHGMLPALRAGWASGRITTPATRERITGAVGAILASGVAEGTVRADIEADDVVAMLLGVFLSTGGADDPAQTVRLLDLLVAGVATRTPR